MQALKRLTIELSFNNVILKVFALNAKLRKIEKSISVIVKKYHRWFNFFVVIVNIDHVCKDIRYSTRYMVFIHNNYSHHVKIILFYFK